MELLPTGLLDSDSCRNQSLSVTQTCLRVVLTLFVKFDFTVVENFTGAHSHNIGLAGATCADSALIVHHTVAFFDLRQVFCIVVVVFSRWQIEHTLTFSRCWSFKTHSSRHVYLAAQVGVET